MARPLRRELRSGTRPRAVEAGSSHARSDNHPRCNRFQPGSRGDRGTGLRFQYRATRRRHPLSLRPDRSRRRVSGHTCFRLSRGLWAPGRRTVDMRANFDGGKSQCLDLLQLAHRAGNILCANHADTGEIARRLGNHGRDLLVHNIGEVFRVIRGKPVRQQPRHRRQHLHVGAILHHVQEPPFDVPRAASRSCGTSCRRSSRLP
jgi:hypothetical protein